MLEKEKQSAEMFKGLLNKEEIRRLEKAARDKNKDKLWEWAQRYEDALNTMLQQTYNALYEQEVQDAVNNFTIGLLYTLYYSEEFDIPIEKIQDFMVDLYATMNMYRTGEYQPDDFKKELKEQGIILDEYKYSALYKEKLEKLDNLIKEYEKKLAKLDNSH